MAPSVPSAAPKRRTQAERRASTQAALLNAAMECLVEEGYANLTTRRVAERAGVSQGTQMHYFPTRGKFVAEAVRHVTLELGREMRDQGLASARGKRPRMERLLDELWEIHKGPIFQAAMELWVAARTDEEVRASVGEFARDVNRLIAETAADLFPELFSKPGAAQLLDTAMASMRGLAMLIFHGDPAVERRWKATRAHLLELYQRLEDVPASERSDGRGAKRAAEPAKRSTE